MVPPHGEDTAFAAGRVEVDRARKVAGEAFFMKGHMALDCRRTASMVAASIGRFCVCGRQVEEEVIVISNVLVVLVVEGLT